MRTLVLLLILFVSGCISSESGELIKLENKVTELQEALEKNTETDKQNWMLDIYQQKQLELLLKEREKSIT